MTVLNKKFADLQSIISNIDNIDKIEDLIQKEKQSQNRKNVISLLNLQYQKIMLSKYGYNFKLLERLLNDVPFYQPNKKKEDFSEEQKQAILKRDNYTCQLCYARGKNLVVHHIYPQGSANSDNLITLCTSCHTAIHRLLRAKGYPYYYKRGD